MKWLIDNKEWLFSGLMVAVPIAIIGWLFIRNKKTKIQKQKGGHGSTNIQVGRDIRISKEKNDD